MSTGPVRVDAYIDFQCPFCRAFELSSGDALRAMAGPGLTDEQLLELGVSVGLTGPTFARCVPEHPYVRWADHVTQQAMARGVSATPTTLVGGVLVPANARAIAAASAAR